LWVLPERLIALRIALLIPSNLDHKRSQVYSSLLRPPPPLGMAYVAAQVRAAGHEVLVIDQFAECLGIEEVVSRIVAFRADAVGYSCLTPNVPMVGELIRALRARLPEARHFVGNAHASEYPESLLEQPVGADVVVHDEGELTTVALLAAWQAGEDLAQITGISRLVDGRVVTNARRAPIDDLDGLARPAWDLFPIKLYRNSTQYLFPGDEQMLAVNLSRGCPWKCTYCAQNFFRTDTRRRDPDEVADEVAWFVREYGVTHFGFTDAIFPLSKSDALRFAEGIERRGLSGKLRFLAATRVDLVDREAFAALKKAGLHIAYLGIESASDETLAEVQKRATRDQARAAVATLKSVGVLAYGLFVLGLPGETRKSMRETLDFALELDCDVATFSRMTPYAGAPLDREQRLVARPDFQDTHDNWHRGAPVKRPGTELTIADVSRFQRWAMLRFFARPRVLARILSGRYVRLSTLALGGASLATQALAGVVEERMGWTGTAPSASGDSAVRAS
jgi:anaerobic magnesium-protoporphyrin IX monomethyl ester cyclase